VGLIELRNSWQDGKRVGFSIAKRRSIYLVVPSAVAGVASWYSRFPCRSGRRKSPYRAGSGGDASVSAIRWSRWSQGQPVTLLSRRRRARISTGPLLFHYPALINCFGRMPAAGATTTTKCHQEKRERAMKTSWCSDKMWAPVIYHHRMGTGPVGFFFGDLRIFGANSWSTVRNRTEWWFCG
jgi:hypothetical protein